MKRLWAYVWCSLVFIGYNDVTPDEQQVVDEVRQEMVPLFRAIPEGSSGIDFVNKLTETPAENIFTYEYFYNGSGVGVGDFNGDSLPDIYFGANQSGDKLYLNKGNFTFEDVTESSGIYYWDGWTTGVSIVDINADGHLDIYVCRSGKGITPKSNVNRLFVNKGDGTFDERAKEYGLAYRGHSNQALFIDADQDNDLDMYLMTHPVLNGNVTFGQLLQLQKDGKLETDRFFYNEDGLYVDGTEKSGIVGNGFGLGLASADLNQDGLTDIYVANDYDEPDYIWLAQGDGTFKNGANDMLPHMSNYSMGCDIGDINSDGLSDIFTADMAFESHFRSKTNMPSMRPELFNQRVAIGYHYQYMHNTLQLNRGGGKFSEIANWAGVTKTDWSWAALIEDVNQDGKKDIFVSNGYRRDIRENDLRLRINKQKQEQGTGEFVLTDVLSMVNSTKVPNRLFLQGDELTFKLAEHKGLDQPSFSNGAAFADFDNDGDLDLVVNNLDMESGVYENTTNGSVQRIGLAGKGQNPNAIGAEVKLVFGDHEETIVNQTTRGYLSSFERCFSIDPELPPNRIDVLWPDGQKTSTPHVAELAVISQAEAADYIGETEKNLLFEKLKVNGLPEHKENPFDDFQREILLPHKYSTQGPALAAADLNGDGKKEIFQGSSFNNPSYLISMNGNKAKATPLPDSERYEDVAATFFDLENDGDLDLYVAVGGSHFPYGSPLYRDRIYLNNGEGKLSLMDWRDAPPSNNSGVIAGDPDQDGDTDLFVWQTYEPGKYGAPSRWQWWRNDGGTLVLDQTILRKDINGMITDALWWDYDEDGDTDMVVCGEWMGILFLANTDGVFQEDKSMEQWNRGGWWQSLTLVETPDSHILICGNMGGNNKFHPTPAKPLHLFAADFDQNGTHDIVLGKHEGDKLYPVRGRECTSEQMPRVAEQFPTFEEFANAELDQIINIDKSDVDIINLEVVEMRHISISKKEGHWGYQYLPGDVQFSPLKDAISMPLNGGGQTKIALLTVGDLYGTEVETTRYDAGYGSMLIWENAEWKSIPAWRSGWMPEGDLRHVVDLGNNLVGVLSNEGTLEVFQQDLRFP